MWEYQLSAPSPTTTKPTCARGEISLLCVSAGGPSPWEFIILLLDIALEYQLKVFMEPVELS